jgi:hypothetical protein
MPANTRRHDAESKSISSSAALQSTITSKAQRRRVSGETHWLNDFQFYAWDG